MKLKPQIIKYLVITLSVLIVNLACSNSYGLADGVEITGEKLVSIPVKDKTNKIVYKKIKLNSVNINHLFKNKIYSKLNKIDFNNKYLLTAASPINPKEKLSLNVDLGMANVPVLDQGTHGTCVTFAVTAALDAYKNAGDYISQQCLLELGNYEEIKSKYAIPSGWDGAEYDDVLLRINKYGIVDKQTCPHIYANSTYKMKPIEYKNYSFGSQWAHDFDWQQLDTMNDDGELEPASLEQVKQSLNSGHRVLIGYLLIAKQGSGKPINQKASGLWDLPDNYSIKDFIRDLNKDQIGGHAVIVIGYDDTHRVLKVRNSWGTKYNGVEVGDNGDFYLSYDYFETMNIDAIEIY